MSASQRRECCSKPVGSAPTGTTTKMRPATGAAKIPGTNTQTKVVPVGKLNKSGA